MNNTAPHITCAIVTNRAAIKTRSLRKYGSAAIQLFSDSADLREVTELRLFASGAARLETRRYADYDTERNTWRTDLGARFDDIEDTRAANQMAKQMLAQMATLHPCRHNTHATEFFYTTPGL